jgi:hypothetical protein
MKSKLWVPVLLVVFLAGSAVAYSQDRNEKKVHRIMKKIEKQNQKLQKLHGERGFAYSMSVPAIRSEELARIREEAEAQREAAMDAAAESREAAREAMEESREAMREHKRAMEEYMKEYHADSFGDMKELKGMKELKELKEIEGLPAMKGKAYAYTYKMPKFRYGVTEPIVIEAPDVKVDIPEFEGNVLEGFYSGNQDNLSINKELTDETSTADFNYEVKKGATGMSVGIKGSIDTGKVVIVIKRPDGKVFNEYTLSSLANVNWRQSLKFEDLEESEYLGKWTVTVTAENAKGDYSVRLGER